MKIAFLCHSVFTDGGVQRVVTEIANLLSLDNEVDIICTQMNVDENRKKYGLLNTVRIKLCKYDKENLMIMFIKKILKGLNKYFGILNKNYLCKYQFITYYSRKEVNSIIELINKNDYDIIIGCEGFYAVLLGYIKNNIKGKTIGWQHSSYDAYFNGKIRYYGNRESMFSNYLKKLDENIVLSNQDRIEYKLKLDVDCRVIYNPVSFQSTKKIKSKKIVLSAGRLVKQKGFDMLIESFKIFKEFDKDNWILKIIGSGEEEEALRKQIIKLNLDKYIVIEPFTNDIKSEMEQAGIFVLASRNEGFGLVVIEALECGIPVISFNNSGPKEILSGHKCGELVERNDINSLSESIIKLTKNKDLRELYSYNAKVRAKDFYKEKILKQWNEILKIK